MAGPGGTLARAGWYPDPQDADRARYWDGTSWTEHRATRSSLAGPAPVSWAWRLAVLSILPWLAFEAVLLLVPVWAPDESYTLGGTIRTLVPYALFVATPGVVLAIVTTRRVVLAVEGMVMVAAATWAATTMVSSDDAQAGLAVLFVWYAAVPVLLLAAGAEWWMRHRLSTRRALP